MCGLLFRNRGATPLECESHGHEVNKSASLVVVEQYAFRAVRFPKNSVLGAKAFDRLLLLSVDPACDFGHVELPRLENETHSRLDSEA